MRDGSTKTVSEAAFRVEVAVRGASNPRLDLPASAPDRFPSALRPGLRRVTSRLLAKPRSNCSPEHKGH
jgi:hypothetical protein